MEQFFLTSIDLYFKDIDLPARISIQFLDDSSYEVSIYFNYHDLTLKYNDWSSFLEKLLLNIIDILNLLYGVLGIERYVLGIEEMMSLADNLPVDKAFYNFKLIKDYKMFMSLLDDCFFIIEIENKGVYFKKSSIDQYDMERNYTLENELSKILFDHLKSI